MTQTDCKFPEEQMCHCGKPLHYDSQEARDAVEELIREQGERMKVYARGRNWWVPRHYIALHGLRAESVHELGFEEVC